ncbi:MAG: PAS domain-containing protein [Myxococcales bacterium]|nr:PAS domain-containing protein [Myxococcales bacterium]MCB9755997.1 PAS domain-containing protein [Myxococcales bacterium]
MHTLTEVLNDEQLAAMTPHEFDALPYGVIKLDGRGRVTLFNAVEQRLAKRAANATIGKDFFRDVAPCADVQAFRGRLDALRDAGQNTETFDFVFTFPWGTREVRIRLWIATDGASWIFVTPLTPALG